MGIFDKTPSKREELEARLSDHVLELRDTIARLEATIKAKGQEKELAAEAHRLRKEIAQLEINKDKIVETNARDRREVEHMVGLERKRQQFEAEQAMKAVSAAREQAILEVKQENLETERKAFVKEMAFREERFTAEVGYLKGLMGEILDRLPTVTVDRQISEKTTTTK